MREPVDVEGAAAGAALAPSLAGKGLAYPAPHAALLQPVVDEDPGHEQGTGGNEAQLQRGHALVYRLGYPLDSHAVPVAASSSASAMSTATTREIPGSGIVMPIS